VGKEARQRLRRTISHEQLRGTDEAVARIPCQPSYERLAEQYLESSELVPHHITALRRVTGDLSSSRLPFHQDEPIVGRPLLNIWVALDGCGVGRPGIEVVLTPRTDILPPSPELSDFAANQVALDEALVCSGRMASERCGRRRSKPATRLSSWAPRFIERIFAPECRERERVQRCG
jgi:hypothetical protein